MSLLRSDSNCERRCGEATPIEMKRSGIERGVVSKAKFNNLIILVAMRFGETPVHIPNTMVKTKAADDTMLETAWESRWLPDL